MPFSVRPRATPAEYSALEDAAPDGTTTRIDSARHAALHAKKAMVRFLSFAHDPLDSRSKTSMPGRRRTKVQSARATCASSITGERFADIRE